MISESINEHYLTTTDAAHLTTRPLLYDRLWISHHFLDTASEKPSDCKLSVLDDRTSSGANPSNSSEHGRYRFFSDGPFGWSTLGPQCLVVCPFLATYNACSAM